MASNGHKLTLRQRWTPTTVQLQILERIFDQGNGTPSKLMIKENTAELSRHGQISETSVYIWFQNRRDRSKRKRQNVAPSNTEVEVKAEKESSKEKKTKAKEYQPQHTVADNFCFHEPEIRSDLKCWSPQSNKPDCIFPTDCGLSTGNFSHMSTFDEVLSNSTIYDEELKTVLHPKEGANILLEK